MYKPRTLLVSLCCLLCFASLGRAQVHESVTGDRPHLWVGAEYSDFDPDYNFFRVEGVGFWGDYMVTHRYGAEAEIRLLDLNKPAGLTEKTFLGGPIADLYQFHHLTAYVKILAGLGTVNYSDNIGYGSYFAFAPGGGVEYHFSPRWKVRAEYDYEFFPSAPGFPGQPSNGLTPNGVSFGVAYHIF